MLPHHLAPVDFTDRELLARMLERDEVAWREFHRRYDRLLYRCIHKVTDRFRSVLGSDDVAEIYAQLLLNLTARDMHRLRAFRPEQGNKLGTWIGMLATNTAWDYLRSISRRPSCAELTDAHALQDESDDSPLERLEQKERWTRVNDALRTFSRKDRDFIQLYYVEGLSPEEVAAEMEISIKTVYSKKHKIRCRLASTLGGITDSALA
ncbi:MAG: sigma-70 family RNA polymerase sigma factor [Polyangiaceae bacterium]|nr:sigma-70 family RNA polymerase sigma factor [Polyangiaceae bacterium]